MAQPRDAEITIIGGGAIGCAVAYHLALSGRADLQVLERGEIAGATTSQAAGLVGQVRSSAARSRLAMSSVALFADMERATGYPVDWRQTGSIRIAMTEAREAELRDMAAVAASVGLDVEFLSEHRVRDLCPVIDTTAVRAALWCPTDGYLQPHSLTTAYAKAARDLGATICPYTEVVGIDVSDGAVTGVRTPNGTVRTDLVIDAAGPWASAVAAMVGVDLPIIPVRHEYFVSDPVDGWRSDLPVLRIPDIRVYVRAEVSRVLCGGWEGSALSLDPRRLPAGTRLPVDPDWDVLTAFADDLARFVPAVSDTGIVQVFRGWPGFVPDGRFVIGPVPGLRGFVMAAGCNAHGVSGSAGIAQHVLESMEPEPSSYVRSLSPGRFLPATWSWEDARRRAEVVYEDYYYGLASAAQGGHTRA